MKIYVIHGPNINMLGNRESEHYGTQTLEELNSSIIKESESLGIEVEIFQFNSEGDIITKLQEANNYAQGVIINPGAYTHYSIAIRDAIAAISKPVIEVHISNIFNRESFRSHSVIAPVAKGQISGMGFAGYLLALNAFIKTKEG
ncbi:type II 3-dehydroquinate dehydratase [Natranaerobius thermophilus]|uniref:3-dehydroquinate dehydratase n=1 Tax=Natranaerobius thermophilus (strain ATCC BAA-1301 / DSM 18059 / JW/NM-WN-LF) TaxID=457570 RepID=B2A551_NATTJ|nr:type II 3-dehydroquinate dehydratase [Natranaerobius thermophilus]ACB85293.1 3-dehydroquinate dehydratase [Natranaerobius thermophilus JW/NM-WN-LF]